MFSGIIGTILTSLFQGLFAGLFNYLDGGRRDEENKALGRAETTAKVNQETAETLDDMANVQRPSDDEVEGRLAAGTI